MGGYTDLVINIVDLLIFAIPLAKEIIGQFCGAVGLEDLQKALNHFYLGLTGANAWIGYLMAAVYYMAVDQGYGSELCEVSGVLATLVTFAHGFIDWNQTNDRYTTQAAIEAESGQSAA